MYKAFDRKNIAVKEVSELPLKFDIAEAEKSGKLSNFPIKFANLVTRPDLGMLKSKTPLKRISCTQSGSMIDLLDKSSKMNTVLNQFVLGCSD